MSITNPSPGSAFTVGQAVVINASAADADGTVAKVDFYANGVLIGTARSTPFAITWLPGAVGSYSLVAVAQALAAAVGAEHINDLPISYDIAWYEQKAVLVLLALLHLGVKGIRLGPTLPAFLSPNVAAFLVETFDLKAIGSAQADVAAMLVGA